MGTFSRSKWSKLFLWWDIIGPISLLPVYFTILLITSLILGNPSLTATLGITAGCIALYYGLLVWQKKHIIKTPRNYSDPDFKSVFPDDRFHLLGLDKSFSQVADYGTERIWKQPYVLVVAPIHDGCHGRQTLWLEHHVPFGAAVVKIAIKFSFKVTGDYNWQSFFYHYGKPGDANPRPIVFSRDIKTHLQYQIHRNASEIDRVVRAFLGLAISMPKMKGIILSTLRTPNLPENCGDAKLEIGDITIVGEKEPAAQPVTA